MALETYWIQTYKPAYYILLEASNSLVQKTNTPSVLEEALGYTHSPWRRYRPPGGSEKVKQNLSSEARSRLGGRRK